MSTQLQTQQAADIRAGAAFLLENFSRKAFESKIKRVGYGQTAGNPGDWKSSPVNSFSRAVLRAGGYGHLNVSTYAGVTVLGVHNGETEYFETRHLPGCDAGQECHVKGWEQYQQVITPDWAYYIEIYAWDCAHKIEGRPHDRKSSKESILQLLKAFDTDTMPSATDGISYPDGARKWVRLQHPLSFFIE